MSSSSSSSYGTDDQDVVSNVDANADHDDGFDGWGIDNEISFDEPAAPAAAFSSVTNANKISSVNEEAWPEVFASKASANINTVPIGQNEADEEEDYYEGDMDDEDMTVEIVKEQQTESKQSVEAESEDVGDDDDDDEENASIRAVREEEEARLAQRDAEEKRRTAEQQERLLQRKKEQAEREKKEADEAANRVREEREKAERARREAELAAQKAEKERKEADQATEKAKRDRAKPAEVDPIPKETIPGYFDRTSDTNTAASTESSPSKIVAPTNANEADVLLAQHSNAPQQIVKAQSSSHELETVKASLQQLFQYVSSPAESRAISFRNSHFSARSKDVTVNTVERVRSALSFTKNLVPTGTKTALDFDRLKPTTNIEPLLANISQVLAAYVASQRNVESQTRRALSLALITAVIDKTDRENLANTALILAYVVGSLLISEAGQLKTAEMVAETESKKKQFRVLRAKIVTDVNDFLSATRTAMVGGEYKKKFIDSVAEISSSFPSAAEKYAFAANPVFGKKSYGTALAMLLREFVRYNPVNTIAVGTELLTQLLLQSFSIMPDIIIYPVAMYDVLAGMLDGIRGLLSVVDVESDRKKILEFWSVVSKALSGQALSAANSKQPAAQLSAAAPIKQSATTKFRHRFATDSDSE